MPVCVHTVLLPFFHAQCALCVLPDYMRTKFSLEHIVFSEKNEISIIISFCGKDILLEMVQAQFRISSTSLTLKCQSEAKRAPGPTIILAGSRRTWLDSAFSASYVYSSTASRSSLQPPRPKKCASSFYSSIQHAAYRPYRRHTFVKPIWLTLTSLERHIHMQVV